jgi:hypothetical protein
MTTPATPARTLALTPKDVYDYHYDAAMTAINREILRDGSIAGPIRINRKTVDAVISKDMGICAYNIDWTSLERRYAFAGWRVTPLADDAAGYLGFQLEKC